MVMILVLLAMVAMGTVGEDMDQTTEDEEVPREALMDQMVKAPLMEDVEVALTSLPFHWSIIYLVQVMEVNLMDITMGVEVVVSLWTMLVLLMALIRERDMVGEVQMDMIVASVCKVWY
jgi:hypothetical protein